MGLIIYDQKECRPSDDPLSAVSMEFVISHWLFFFMQKSGIEGFELSVVLRAVFA